MVRATRLITKLLVAFVGICNLSQAQAQTRYVTEGGVTYRETVRRVVEPVYETALVQQPQVAYQNVPQVEVREQIQTTWVPETRYQARTVWRPTGGFFSPRVPVQECVPVTTWRPQTRSVQVPTTVYRPVATPAATASLPVQNVRYVQRDVVTRTPVGPLGWFASRTTGSSAPPWRLGWTPLQGWAWNRQPAAIQPSYVAPTYVPPTSYPAVPIGASYVAAPAPNTSIVPTSYTADAGGWRASKR